MKRTTCPFCLNGCESGVSFDYQYRMEYVSEGRVNQGRLCPRGNSANLVIDHPKRLGYPLLDGKETNWHQAAGRMKEWLAAVRPEEIAVVQSRGLSEEEAGLVRGFARSLGTPNLVCGYIEPDNCFRFRLAETRPAKLDEVRSAKAVLLVGDVFSTSPVAAGPIVEARYADRKNRLVVLDSLVTRQAGFAHEFIQVRPGTEAFALLALAGLLGKAGGIDVERCCQAAGVGRNRIESAAKILSAAGGGFAGCAMHLGRVRHPVLVSLAAQLVAVKAKLAFTGFGEARVASGTMKLPELRRAAADGKIRMMFWFGGLYPCSYPELAPEFEKVEHRVATSIFRPVQDLAGLVLPVPSELEKESSGQSYWGEVQRHPLASPYSGTRLLAWIVEQLSRRTVAELEPEARSFTQAEAVKLGSQALAANGERRAAPGAVPTANGELLLVGEKRAVGIGGFYTDEHALAVNPDDAARLGLGEGDWAMVTSSSADAELRAHLTRMVPAGALCVGVNSHRNRALFPIEVEPETGEACIPPATVSIEKVELESVLAVEARNEAR